MPGIAQDVSEISSGIGHVGEGRLLGEAASDKGAVVPQAGHSVGNLRTCWTLLWLHCPRLLNSRQTNTAFSGVQPLDGSSLSTLAWKSEARSAVMGMLE